MTPKYCGDMFHVKHYIVWPARKMWSTCFTFHVKHHMQTVSLIYFLLQKLQPGFCQQLEACQKHEINDSLQFFH